MKRKILLDYDKLSKEKRDALIEQYPFGIPDTAIWIRNAAGKRVLGVMLDTEDAVYLIAIDPRKNWRARSKNRDDDDDDDDHYRTDVWTDDDDDDNDPDADNDADTEAMLQIPDED